jgi:squalene cyclase
MIRPIVLMMLGTVWAALAAGSVGAVQQDIREADAKARATNYLRAEVPRWRREHPCYSCHNNGDGARALIAASRKGLVRIDQFNDAVAWLRAPDRWSSNSADGGVKDLPLSRIQFAAALQGLVAAGGGSQAALDIAANLVAADQRSDGAWPISATSNVGTPSGYGTPLATAVAASVLRSAATAPARAAVQRADAWFRAASPEAVLEASAVLLGLADSSDGPAAVARRRALEILKTGQGPDGGWGPYPSSQSEAFDTAVGILALRSVRGNPALAGPALTEAEWLTAIGRGRQFLLERQEADGSWAETTRPALQESYSQRISTTAWALLALLEE